MTVLYHHRTQGRGAEGVHIAGIVQALRAAGHNVLLLSPPGVDPLATQGTYLYGSRSGIAGRLWRYISKTAPQIAFELVELAYNFYLLPRLLRLLRSAAVDVVYERYAFFLWATAWLCRRRGIPLILEVNEVVGLKRARALRMRRIAEPLERYVLQRADGIVTVSSFLLSAIRRLAVAQHHVQIVPNAADPALFSPGGRRTEMRKRLGVDGSVVLGFVGWIDPWDNLPRLFEVMRQLANRDPNVRLLLVGDVAGKGVDRASLLRSMDPLGGSVIAVPGVPRSELPGYLEAMDICVIPDSNEFGSPMVLFEYMAMGRAVVAPDVLPISDVISHEVNGLIFPRGDDSALARAIWRLVSDESFRNRLGASARRSVLNKHTWAVNARSVISIAQRLRNEVPAGV